MSDNTLEKKSKVIDITQKTYQLYGIKNCDTVKKARKWLDEQGVQYCFHDYRLDGLDERLLQRFIDQLGWQVLLNTKSTTWRGLDEKLRSSINDASNAKALMLTHPTLIKRPLLVCRDHYLVGFKAETYQQFLTGIR